MDRRQWVSILVKGTLAAAAMAVVLHPTLRQKTGLSSLFESYGHAFHSIQHKVAVLRHAEEENERLKLENANLRLRVDAAGFECVGKRAEKQVQDLEAELKGQIEERRMARALASVHYRPPTHLLSEHLYTLALSYFKAQEDEKAAVILTQLTSFEEGGEFKTPKNLLMAGVAWYRSGNFEVADQFFEKVIEREGKGAAKDDLPYFAQARLWRGVVAQKSNLKDKAQFWLTELVDHHPYSPEAKWVNGVEEGKRVPASSDSHH